jgi:L-ascorbate metabolism protein UlaG (beta-lactamase superfamily)
MKTKPACARILPVVVSLLGGVGLLCAQNAPQFTGIQRLTNSEMALQFSGSNGLAYRIDVSTNPPQWQSFLTVLSSGSLQYTDSAAPYLSQRFYRAEQLASATNVLTGDHLITTNGDVVIHPINHASFVMSWNGKMIYNDPVGVAALYQGLPRADLILISHDHTDHFSTATLNAVTNATTVIVAPQAVYNGMSAALRSLTTVLTNGVTTNVMGLTITAVPAYNLTSTYHLKGVGNGYVLAIAEKRIYMSGDSEDITDMRGLQDIDVAFVCMNVPFTMTIAKAVSAVRQFHPRVIYPYHYRNQDSSLANLNAFKQQVGTDLGVEVRLRKWY